MWQQRACYEQSNVLDVTIQCQLNVATKNLSEFSTMYGTSMSHFPSDNDVFPSSCSQRVQSNNTNYSARSETPVKYQCEFEANNRRHYSDTDAPSTYSDVRYEPIQSKVPHSIVGYDSAGFYSSCMNDSGYGSPLAQFVQDRNSVFSPCVELSRQSQTGSPVFENVKHASNETNVYNSSVIEGQCEEMKLAMREKDVMHRLYSLRTVDVESATNIDHYYQSQTTIIDLERHNVLCQMAYDKKSSDSIHSYYNRKLLSLLECVEGKLSCVENRKCKGVKRTLNSDRKSRLLPKHAVKLMQSWYEENLENPYPSREVTQSMAAEGGVTVEQIRKWFANKRNRSRNNKLKASDMDLEEL